MTYLIRNGADLFKLDHYGDGAIHTTAGPSGAPLFTPFGRHCLYRFNEFT
jgi:hypothetical protein